MAGGRFGQDGLSQWNRITTNATTTIKTGSGVLRRILINKAGTTGNIATVNVDGNTVAAIDTTVVRPLEFNIPFSASLSVVTATGTAGELTVLYN